MVQKPPHLSVKDVLERFQICRSTLHNWTRDKDLAFPKPIRVRGRYYFPLPDIEKWEETHGRVIERPVETVEGRPVISGVIQNYQQFVAALTRRRKDLNLSCLELDARSGMQEGYSNKLENHGKEYGRGVGPEVFPLWLGGLKCGIVLVDLPRKPRASHSVRNNMIDRKAAS